MKSLFFLLLPLSLIGLDFGTLCQGHRVGLGPEVFYMTRRQTGGNKQDGWLFGGRGQYIRQIPWGLYLGVEGYYTCGNLDGCKTDGDHLVSDKIDSEVEGYIGATATTCLFGTSISLTPFTGYGKFWGENNFKEPKKYKTKSHFRFYLVGGEVKVSVCEELEGAVRFKARFVDEAERFSYIPNDEVRKKRMGDKVNYDVELPIIFKRCICNKLFSVEVVPFYRFRDYGEWENSPSDFKEEQYRLWGVRLMANYHF